MNSLSQEVSGSAAKNTETKSEPTLYAIPI